MRAVAQGARRGAARRDSAAACLLACVRVCVCAYAHAFTDARTARSLARTHTRARAHTHTHTHTHTHAHHCALTPPRTDHLPVLVGQRDQHGRASQRRCACARGRARVSVCAWAWTCGRVRVGVDVCATHVCDACPVLCAAAGAGRQGALCVCGVSAPLPSTSLTPPCRTTRHPATHTRARARRHRLRD
jgi:hypothetical protein